MASLLTASITTDIDPFRDLALNACRMHQIDPDLVFADRCATACELNTQMAHHAHDLALQMAESAQRFWASSPAQPPGLTANNLTAGLQSSGFQRIAIQYTETGLNDGPIALARRPRSGKLRAEITAVKSAGQPHIESAPE